MPEIKHKVVPVEVNYVCDSCGHGMMKLIGEADAANGVNEHECMICGAKATFQWKSYPHIDYLSEEEVL
ncbi:MAG: hypothetical protein V7711_10340 [Pseudomonadales bacterium]